MSRDAFSKALITGAAGDLGSRLARRLAERGVNLVLLDCAQPPLAALASELGARVRVASYVVDQTDLERFESVVRNGTLMEFLMALQGDSL